MIARMSSTELQIPNRWNNADIVCSLAVLAVYELTYSFFGLEMVAAFGRIAFCDICLLALPRFGFLSKEENCAEFTNAFIKQRSLLLLFI